MKEQIKIGDKVKDMVTGFSGIATARIEYLNGCIQFCVETKQMKKDEMPKAHYIDEKQLEKIGNGLNTPEKKIVKKRTGGSMPNCPDKL